MNKCLFIFMFLLFSQTLEAQSILEEYIEIGLKNNQAYLTKKLDTKYAGSRHKEAIGEYLPSLTFNAR